MALPEQLTIGEVAARAVIAKSALRLSNMLIYHTLKPVSQRWRLRVSIACQYETVQDVKRL